MAKICGLEMAGLIKAKWTMQLDPCFDEDFNVVDPGKK